MPGWGGNSGNQRPVFRSAIRFFEWPGSDPECSKSEVAGSRSSLECIAPQSASDAGAVTEDAEETPVEDQAEFGRATDRLRRNAAACGLFFRRDHAALGAIGCTLRPSRFSFHGYRFESFVGHWPAAAGARRAALSDGARMAHGPQLSPAAALGYRTDAACA